MINDPNLVFGVFVLLVLSGQYLQRKVYIIRKLSSAMYCIFGAMVLSNIGLIPKWSDAHNFVFSYIVPFSIAFANCIGKENGHIILCVLPSSSFGIS